MSGYWNARKHFEYYALVRAWLDAISSRIVESSILDVGCLDTPIATWGTFDKRYTVDIAYDPHLLNVQSFVVDFMEWTPPHSMTAVTCLQVLEHLSDDIVYEFAQKLRATGEYIIISVPFMWDAGYEPAHKQDPIDHDKIETIMGGPPDSHAIIRDTRHRRFVGLWQ